MPNVQGSSKSQVQSWALRHWELVTHRALVIRTRGGGRGSVARGNGGGECCLAAGSLSVRVAEGGFDDVGEALVEVAAGFGDDGFDVVAFDLGADFVGVFGSDDDDGDVAAFAHAAEALEEGDAVHAGHHDVQEDEIDV